MAVRSWAVTSHASHNTPPSAIVNRLCNIRRIMKTPPVLAGGLSLRGVFGKVCSTLRRIGRPPAKLVLHKSRKRAILKSLNVFGCDLAGRTVGSRHSLRRNIATEIQSNGPEKYSYEHRHSMIQRQRKSGTEQVVDLATASRVPFLCPFRSPERTY